MRDNSECRCYVDHLIAEHRRLHKLLRQMRAAIAGSIGPDEHPSFAEVGRILARLRQELAQHFAEEEGGGCMDEAVSRCPRLAPEVKRIEAEHAEILTDIDRLKDEAALPPTPANQMAVQREFDRLYERLQAHERAENAILAQGFGMVVNGTDEEAQPALILDV